MAEYRLPKLNDLNNVFPSWKSNILTPSILAQPFELFEDDFDVFEMFFLVLAENNDVI